MTDQDKNHDGKISISEAVFDYIQHPHIDKRHDNGPVKVADQLPQGNAFTRFNSALGLKITKFVGTMVCAYFFAIISLISLPAAIHTHDVIVIVSWVAQTFLQLVLLSIIIVGQNIQARAADLRAEQTFKDAEAILAECIKLQEHLMKQDSILLEQDKVLNSVTSALATKGA